MVSLYRSNDAVLTVCQNNPKQSIEIIFCNDAAEALLGYGCAELAGKSLLTVLAASVQALIKENVEFTETGNDLEAVLGKRRELAIRAQNGAETTVGFKLMRIDALDRNARFEVILQPDSEVRKVEAIRAARRENFKGHEVLDTESGLPDRNSVIRDLEIARNHAASSGTDACFAVAGIDDFAAYIKKYGKPAAPKMLAHIAGICKQKLRTDDVVGCATEGMVGLLLMDIRLRAARIVLNRMRWLIASQPFTFPGHKPVNITVSIAYCRIGADTQTANIMADAEKYLSEVRGKGANIILEMAV